MHGQKCAGNSLWSKASHRDVGKRVGAARIACTPARRQLPAAAQRLPSQAVPYRALIMPLQQQVRARAARAISLRKHSSL